MTDGYILGSDGNGRDILTRLAFGGRISIMIAVLSAFATFFLGGAIGLLSGYAGGESTPSSCGSSTSSPSPDCHC